MEPSPSPPAPPPSPPPTRDVAARQQLLPLSLSSAALGFVGGAVYSVQTGYPLRSSTLRSAVNCLAVSFTFLSTSLAVAEHCPPSLAPMLRSTALPNNALAGAVTFGVMGGVIAGSRGQLTDVRTAAQAGLRAAAAGALLGAAWWTGQRAWQSWSQRRQSRQVKQQQPQQPSAVAQSEGGDSSDVAGGDSSTSSTSGPGWLPAWSPVRRATAADLARHEAEAEQTRRRAQERLR